MNTTVAERGQVTIPKALRDKLGITPGTVLDFTAENGRLVATKQHLIHGALKLLGKHGRERRTADIMAELRGRDQGFYRSHFAQLRVEAPNEVS